jgi:hypothetical protein
MEDFPALGWLAVSTILANVLTTGFALVLLRRHPNRRLRYLVLMVGMVSFTQTAALFGMLNVRGLSEAIGHFHYFITAMAGMSFIYVLWREISDRNRTDRMLRLAEHENQVMQSRLERKPTTRTSELPVVSSNPN